MSERRLRVLAISSHVVQYAAPVFRKLASCDEIDFHVAYCSLRGAEAGHDPELGAVMKWDVPLLDGYAWTHVPNKGSGKESFFGLFNPGLWKLIRQGHYDAILCYIGYVRSPFWIGYFAAKMSGSRFLFGNDAITISPRDGKAWKVTVKKRLWPRIFKMADQVFVPSMPARDLMLSLGLPAERVTIVPIVVDNDWWASRSSEVQRDSVRKSWGVTPADAVVLFCAKLQPWKRPLDLLQAFAHANVQNTALMFAGDGPQRAQLEAEAKRLGIASRVRFLGFVNQSELPAIYTSADAMVLPSEFEPFAVVVNEAMCCGCPVIASDAVGSARDLIVPVRGDFIYPSGDVAKLTELLKKTLSDRAGLKQLREAFSARMRTWSPAQNMAATLGAVRLAVGRNRSTVRHDGTNYRDQTKPGPGETLPG
jgi:glycosyltransferase involved in cell wall biosynthesis